MSQGPDIFLSSTFQNFMDVREQIRGVDARRIWEPIDNRQGGNDRPAANSPFCIVDECLAQIRRSSLFICVLRDRYGTSVFAGAEEAEDAESVSFLETEIYQAALFHSNVHFFLMEPFNPSPKLKGLLDLVEVIRPDVIPKRPLPQHIVLDQIRRLIDNSSGKRRWVLGLRRFVSGLERARGHPREDIELFDKTFRPISKRPDLDHIRVLLEGLEGERSIEKRLSRTWIAIRELSSAPYNDPDYREYLPQWDQALGVWSSAAAWYGLHGHLYAGRLAAINSLLAIRARLPNVSLHESDERHFHGTKGARASEYYSMAKLMWDRKKRAEYFHLAILDIEEALRAGSDAPSGYLTIRGHIRLRLGDPKLALQDFEEARRLSEGRSGVAIAESLADVGFAKIRLGGAKDAVPLLEESVQRFVSMGEINFAVRAKKRLALAYFWSRHPNKAARELNEAYDMALAYQVFDQIAPIMEIVHRVSSATGLWKSRGN